MTMDVSKSGGLSGTGCTGMMLESLSRYTTMEYCLTWSLETRLIAETLMFHSFFQGDSGMKGRFATRVSGSSDLYQVRFIQVHFFFSVSVESK